jgi:hypothetical protein
MPRKRAISTISELNDLNRNHNRRRKKKIEKALDSPFTMELAFRVMRRHQSRLDRDPKYFYRFPNYDEVILAAAQKCSPSRGKRAQGANGNKPSKNRALRIGPIISIVFGSSEYRLPRTPDSVIVEYIGRNGDCCKTLWRNQLPPWLEPLGFELLADESKIGKDRYVFVREGAQWSISFGEFQKLFSRARKR